MHSGWSASNRSNFAVSVLNLRLRSRSRSLRMVIQWYSTLRPPTLRPVFKEIAEICHHKIFHFKAGLTIKGFAGALVDFSSSARSLVNSNFFCFSVKNARSVRYEVFLPQSRIILAMNRVDNFKFEIFSSSSKNSVCICRTNVVSPVFLSLIYRFIYSNFIT
jgi:hypothetical protein